MCVPQRANARARTKGVCVDLFEYQASQLGRAANDVAGELTGTKVHLYKTALPVDGTTDLATFHTDEATFTGYAAKSITWLTPSVSDDGIVEVVGTVPEFRPTDSVAPNDIWGIYITDTAAATLLFCGQFDNPPLPMNGTTDAIVVTIRFRPADQSIAVQIS
jgi:hypothetical protein